MPEFHYFSAFLLEYHRIRLNGYDYELNEKSDLLEITSIHCIDGIKILFHDKKLRKSNQQT